VKRLLVAGASAAALVALVTSAAYAAKPGSGSHTGTGQVFLPNPVADLQDETLTDQKDADYPALQPAYHTVTLTNLDGSGFLRGDYANIVSETGNPAYSPTNTFVYNRHQDEFEQVMAYYWITQAERYIQSLGFGSRFPAIQNEPQNVRINQFGQDNSFETDHPKDELRFGKGGVDDAEDAEVILHEYGHAIHVDQSPTFYSSAESSAIGEGFGDYWAVTVSSVVAPTPDEACVMDWDSTSYTSTVPHCLRRVDRDLHYPADLNGEPHHDGLIWSRALWDIRNGLGNVRADTIILDAQFGFPGTTMHELAQRTVNTAQALYGAAPALIVQSAFHNRGIL
jgi:zinc metalloprotease ZmpB